jgi:hypothetical protein
MKDKNEKQITLRGGTNKKGRIRKGNMVGVLSVEE